MMVARALMRHQEKRQRPTARSAPRPVRQSGATTLLGAGSPAAFPFAWTLARFAAKRRVRPRADQTASTAAPRNPMQRRCADRPVSPFRRVDEFCYHPQGALWASANRRSFSKTDERQVVLELGLEGKFAAKSTGWDEKPDLPRRGPVEIGSQGRRWVLCHVPARPAAPKPVLHYFPDDE